MELLTAPLPKDDGEDAEERQPWPHGALLPVRVVLRDFAARGLPAGTAPATAEPLWQFLETELKEGQQGEFGEPLKKALQKGEALVLLDGLDEVPEAQDRRERICQAVEKFVEAYPDNRFVVTSRTFAWDLTPHLARLGPMSVWDLTPHLAHEAAGEASENAWGLHLAGQVVVESANYEQASGVNQERLQALRQRLPSLLASPELPASERALAGGHLARLGDPRFDAELWSLPADASAGFLEVPGGEYEIGEGKSRHTVGLSPFWVSRWPVTVAQFRAFVEATGFEIGDQRALRGVANHPVVWVSWDEARAYCEWLTERLREVATDRAAAATDADAEKLWSGFASGAVRAALPTEAQWEAAARGPEYHYFPWGRDEPTAEHANFTHHIGGPTPVGTYPMGRGPFGAEDQAGNVWEWCADAWDDDAYEKRVGQPIAVDPCNDSGKSADWVVRGGSWAFPAQSLRTGFRFRLWPRARGGFLGFRVFGSGPEHA